MPDGQREPQATSPSACPCKARDLAQDRQASQGVAVQCRLTGLLAWGSGQPGQVGNQAALTVDTVPRVRLVNPIFSSQRSVLMQHFSHRAAVPNPSCTLPSLASLPWFAAWVVFVLEDHLKRLHHHPHQRRPPHRLLEHARGTHHHRRQHANGRCDEGGADDVMGHGFHVPMVVMKQVAAPQQRCRPHAGRIVVVEVGARLRCCRHFRAAL